MEYTIWRDSSGAVVDESHPDASPHKLSEAEVEKKGDGHVLKSDPSVKVSARAHKMSKSRGNVVSWHDAHIVCYVGCWDRVL